jgi:hypothetical protein
VAVRYVRVNPVTDLFSPVVRARKEPAAEKCGSGSPLKAQGREDLIWSTGRYRSRDRGWQT